MIMKEDMVVTLCVNFCNDDETAGFVRNLVSMPGYDGRVVVVSNSAEGPGGQLSALAALPRVEVDFPESNLGYFGGAAHGLARYLQQNTLPEWLIVCNTDIEFPESSFFCHLREFYSVSPPPAVIAPDIVAASRNGIPSSRTHQNPHMTARPSPYKMRLLALVSGSYARYAAYEFASSLRYRLVNACSSKRKRWTEEKEEDNPRRIYAPFGAFIIFHRSYFEAGGNLDYSSFLFGEEIFVAESVRRLELEVIYDPRLKLLHREHAAMIKLPSRTVAGYVRQSARYLVATYFAE